MNPYQNGYMGEKVSVKVEIKSSQDLINLVSELKWDSRATVVVIDCTV